MHYHAHVKLAVIIAAHLSLCGCTEFLAIPMVRSPNHGRQFDASGDASPAELEELGVNMQLRLDVGPPPASLSLWIIDPTDESGQTPPTPKGTVLLLHGIYQSKDHRLVLPWGRRWAAAGYRTVMVDLRGHGRSSGDWMTYGAVDSRDMIQVIDALAERDLIVGKLGVFGVSYGGATALQLAAEDPRVDAVVTVAAYTSMRDVVPNFARQFLPIIEWFISDAKFDEAIDRAGEMAGFDPDQASALEAISRMRTPVLLIHGAEDRHVRPEHSRILHAAAPEHSQLVLLDDEGHMTMWWRPVDELFASSVAWFDEHLR